MRPQVGQVINNKYRLNRMIGDGGMGSVYEARHEMLGTLVALKFLHPELTRRTGLVQRFLQEAKVSAQIQSPHVVRVMDMDQTPRAWPSSSSSTSRAARSRRSTRISTRPASASRTPTRSSTRCR